MFKEYKGFDTDKIFKGLIVYIHDSYEADENITGFYLVNDCTENTLWLVDDNAVLFSLTVVQFTNSIDKTGDYSPYTRLSLEIPKIVLSNCQ